MLSWVIKTNYGLL